MSNQTPQISPAVLRQDIAANDFSALCGLMLVAIQKIASKSRPHAPASFGVEFTVATFPTGAVDVIARIERVTRTLVFAAAEVRDGSGVRLGVASGVFKVIGQGDASLQPRANRDETPRNIA